MTTIGYGDIPQTHEYGLVLTCIYMWLSVTVVAATVGHVGSMFAEMEMRKKNKDLLKRMDLSSLEAMDQDGDGVDINEFTVAGCHKMLLLKPWLLAGRNAAAA